MMTENEGHPELSELSLRVGDHLPIDWSAEHSADPRTEATIEQLRTLARIADLHRSGAEAEQPALDSRPTKTWGGLRLIEKVGEGGGSEVWRAHDPALQRDVALKIRRDGEARSSLRWLEEARRLARVHHPNVVAVHGADRHDGEAGMWMDLVEGRTLEDLLLELGPLGALEAARIGMEICGALGAVHAAGIVHGDVKTRNVMRVGRAGIAHRSGHILLMDFGSAHERGALETPSLTPLYAAPELLEGSAPSTSSDLYALGVVLFRLTTGRHPVEAATKSELIERVRRRPVISLRETRPDLPLSFTRVVERALAHESSDRYASAAEMEHALAATLELRVSPVSTKRSRWPLVVALLLGVGLGLVAPVAFRAWEQRSRVPFGVDPRGAGVVAEFVGRVDGLHTNDSFGAPARTVGDVDGDGVDDYAVAAIDAENGRGRVTLLRGSADGLASVWRELRADAVGEAFGSSLGSGDLDGDGRLDVVVGAPRASAAGQDAGRVYVWFGSGEFAPSADLRLDGEAPNQYLGYDLDAGGDVDGDGIDDLCVGAPLDERAGYPTGRALVFLGARDFDTVPDLDLTSGASYSQFGVSVKCVDLNGDGHDDVLVGANWENTDAPLAGRVYVYFGGPGVDVTEDLVLRGPHENAMFGFALPVGDVDGDGHVDIATSLQVAGNSGEKIVRLYFGGPQVDARADLEIRGPGGDDGFGASFGPAGDIDGDGIDDYFVGAYTHDLAARNAGAVYLYRGGRPPDAVADLELLGKGTWDLFGSAVAVVQDLDGDGRGGLLIGSRWASDAGRRSGRIDFYEFRR